MSKASQERYYHGTRADLKPGDLIEVGYTSNFGSRKKANHVYPTATFDAAVWGAELAERDGEGRIYVVEYSLWRSTVTSAPAYAATSTPRFATAC